MLETLCSDCRLEINAELVSRWVEGYWQCSKCYAKTKGDAWSVRLVDLDSTQLASISCRDCDQNNLGWNICRLYLKNNEPICSDCCECGECR